jgi:hypothetical protein
MCDDSVMSVDPIFQEFVDVLNALAGAHAFALAGLSKEREYWSERLASTETPVTEDSTVYISNGRPEYPSTVAYSKWRLGDLPELLGVGGAVMTRVSQQWVISVYAEWDEHYRGLISNAMGLAEPLKLPMFGDLRRFRHDIVHHRGIATAENSGRCEVFRDWFRPGQPMFFDVHRVAEFMTKVEAVETLPRQGWK